MEKYNYLQQVTNDVKEYLLSTYSEEFIATTDYAEYFYHELFNEDSVTGNGSGSYFYNRYKAEEAVCHNFELLNEAIDELGYDMPKYGFDAEAMDVIIRCYLLNQALETAVNEIKEEYEQLQSEVLE